MIPIMVLPLTLILKPFHDGKTVGSGHYTRPVRSGWVAAFRDRGSLYFSNGQRVQSTHIYR